MSDFKTTNITYKGLTDRGLTVQLLDGEDRKWTVWKQAYQSDEDSEAWSTLQNFRIGEYFGVSYKETDESFVSKEGKNKGQEVRFKKRTIYSILPPIPVETQPATITSTTKTSTTPANSIPITSANLGPTPSNRIEGTKDDQFWDKKAYKQCLWNYWLEGQFKTDKVGGNSVFLQAGWMDEVWRVFNQIEQDAEKRFNGSPDESPFEEPYPFHDGGTAEDIPF